MREQLEIPLTNQRARYALTFWQFFDSARKFHIFFPHQYLKGQL